MIMSDRSQAHSSDTHREFFNQFESEEYSHVNPDYWEAYSSISEQIPIVKEAMSFFSSTPQTFSEAVSNKTFVVIVSLLNVTSVRGIMWPIS